METNTTEAAPPQVKNIDERIAETSALESESRKVMYDLEKEMEPFKFRYEAARTVWCKYFNKLKYLEEIKADELQETK